MSDQEIRDHLRSALVAVIEAERNRVSAILNDSNIRIAEGIERMKPIIALIRALKEEVGEVEGLEISPAEHGHMAIVRTNTSSSTETLDISTNGENSGFVIKEISWVNGYDSWKEYKKTHEYSSAEDIMARVLEVVGKHIGSQQAEWPYKDD